MIAIKLNGRILDLKPGVSAEIERKSPFFAIDEMAMEASTELTFRYTPNNALAFDMPYQYYTERKQRKYTVEHYDDTTFRGWAVLVIETGRLNLNNIEDTEITGNLLYGLSNFLQDVKDKYLKDLSLGGERSFPFTTSNPTDGSAGFWQHIHDTWTDDTIPYVFSPIRNETWLGDVEYMNGLDVTGKIKFDSQNPIVPLIRMPYLLQQVFIENGWAVDVTGIGDADWLKLVWISTKPIDWYATGVVFDPVTGTYVPAYSTQTVHFSLNKFVPQKKTIGDFVVQLFKRFGWAPVFNPVNRTCRIVAVKDLRNGTRVDWTKYADPIMSTSFKEDAKVFSFTNEIDSNDTLPSSPDFTGKVMGPSAAAARYLQAPSFQEGNTIRFCFQDNKWFIAELDDVLPSYQWHIFADNIYNEEPEGATDTIDTTISTLPIYLTLYRTVSGIDYYGYFPFMKQSRFTDFGYRCVFFHGLCREITVDGVAGVIDIPMASPVLVDNMGVHKTGWSNVYRHKSYAGTILEIDYGLINYWWKDFLQVLQTGEEPVARFYLPLHVLYGFQWDTVVLVQNVPYLVMSFIEPVPYTGVVQANLKRLVKPAAISAPPAPSIYAHLEVVNIRSDYGGTGPYGGWTLYQSCDVDITLFSDVAGTIPYAPAFPLGIVVSTDSSPVGSLISTSFTVTVFATRIFTRVIKSGTADSNGDAYVFDYTLLPDSNGVYTVI